MDSGNTAARSQRTTRGLPRTFLARLGVGRAEGSGPLNSVEASDHTKARRFPWVPLLDTLVVVVALVITLTLTRGLWLHASNDPRLYTTYALNFWTGPQRFHAFPKEYPPLAVLVFGLTLLPPGATDPVATIPHFEDWMGLLFLVGWGLFYRVSGRAAAWRYALLVLVLQNLAFTRYDLVPGLVCVGALWTAQRRSWRWSYLLLALGTLLKIFPAFLVPIVLIEQWRWSGHRLRPALAGIAVFVVTVALGVAIPYALNPASLNSLLGYQSGRPIQIESTTGTIVWLASLLGVPAQMVYTFGSFNLVGPLSSALSPVATVLLGVGLLVVYWQVWRRSLPLAQAFLFCLGMVLLTNKVFSAQYMLWVVPIAAEAGTDFALWLLAAALTLAEYPLLTEVTATFYHAATQGIVLAVVAVRNGLVCWGTVRALRPPSAPARAAQPLPRYGPPQGAPTTPDVSGTLAR